MKILFSNLSTGSYNAPLHNPQQTSYYSTYYGSIPVIKNRLDFDTVNFTGKKINKKEVKKIEEQIRNLDDVHDPYSDVILISKKKFQHLKSKLNKTSNSESTIKLLSGYQKHMFPNGEAKVFEMLKEDTKKWKQQTKGINFNFQDILMSHLLESKGKLINEEFEVLNNIRETSKKLFNKSEQKLVEKRVKKLEGDITNDQFRIKPAKKYLEELYGEIKDKKKVKQLLKHTREFPNGATSVDAFVVKNAHKSHVEIAEALVSPSIISVEHVLPQSEGGETKGTNFIAASKRMNNLRGSMPYEDFIDMFPDIPKQTQRYFDDLKSKINRGGIKDIAITLPDVKDALFKHSKGLINVNISLSPKIIAEIEEFKNNIGKLKEKFEKGK